MGWYNYYNNKLLYLKPDEAFALFLEDVKIRYPGPKYIQRPSVPIPPISLISINPVAPTSPPSSLSSISSPLHISISPAAAPLPSLFSQQSCLSSSSSTEIISPASSDSETESLPEILPN